MSESKAHQVEIREVDGQTLRKLVDYIYTAEIEVTEDNVQVRATSCSPVLSDKLTHAKINQPFSANSAEG